MVSLFCYLRLILNALKFIFLVIFIFITELIMKITFFNLVFSKLRKNKLKILNIFTLEDSCRKFFIFKTLYLSKLNLRKIKYTLKSITFYIFQPTVGLVIRPLFYRSMRFFGAINYFHKNRKNDVNFYNFKHLFNRPGSKTWVSESLRKSEWEFASATPFIMSLEDYYEFDYGTAEHSWNIQLYDKPIDHYMDKYGTEEMAVEQLMEPLLKDSHLDNLFNNQVINFEEI